MNDLAEFLLARIAEDQDAAFGTSIDGYRMSAADGGIATTVGGGRLRAECEAKRRIIEAQRRQEDDDDANAWIVMSNVLLKLLALPYADHEDFRSEWRV